MKKIILVFGILILFSNHRLSAQFTQNGDTLSVQTFTFGSPQDAWFKFPSDTIRIEKILMKYTLKCNPAQSPACGEWDYSTPFYLYKKTGLTDSSVVHQSIYTVNGLAPDSVSYMNTPSYSYYPTWQYSIAHTATTSFNSYTIGTGTTNSNSPFGANNPVSRSQYLWTASEMNTAGVAVGNITGLQFYLQSLGSSLKNLTVRIKHTSLTSLSQSTLNTTGFTTVYALNTQFNTTGWNSLQFTTPFNWDGTSNLLIEIAYDNTQTGTDNVVASSVTSFTSGLTNSGSDRSASFHSTGQVEVPLNNQVAAIDSAVTVAFWAYGTPQYQPQQGDCFEAVDSVGNRILNSHTPWSDSNVYWDAGFNASYDRINKVATTSQIEGQWNYWTFTKNVATGSMKVYLNGTLWHSGTGKIKRMKNIKKFRIGAGHWSGNTTYEGQMDEFAVFNKELSQTTIQAYMNKQIDASHPNYNNLVLYYHFDDGNYLTANDAAPVSHPPALLVNGVNNPLKKATDLVYNFSETSTRPNITFEQGVYTSQTFTTLVVDSVMKTPIQIISYNDSTNNPGVATDTITVWPFYYNNYVYNSQGIATDSTLVTVDSTMHLVYYNWYKKFPQVIRYEIAKYITPYGNGLSLGNGWTWTFDLSDYRTLLADSVHISAGDWRELLDVKFLMIKGTPPRDIVGIKNLWNGSFKYGVVSDPIESHLQPMTLSIPSNAVNSRWKSRVTGHGMDSPENCAEFCPKTHYYKVNGTQRFSQLIWRDNCDLNPLYPQGGTWVYDRANWCPGAEVWTYDFELTPFVTAGNSAVLDHDVQAYTSGGPWNSYDIADQIVYFGAPNFALDAAIEDVISPSTDQMHLRYNQSCDNPIIKIKNTGSSNLTSLTITYGLNGATPSVYNWTGNLKFLEMATVNLGDFNWIPGATHFDVTISNPNGGTDQYAKNNSRVVQYTYPPVMPSQFIIEFKTNNNPGENEYTLKNSAGTVIHSRNGLSQNTTYKDTLTLANDCYMFELTDTGEDGLTWWANTGQGSGYIRFKKVSSPVILKNFNSDFGGQVYQQFAVGLVTDVEDYIFVNQAQFNVFPNPSFGTVYINIDMPERSSGKVEITDVLGRKVYDYQFKNTIAESIEADLSKCNAGIYFVTLKTDKETLSQKVILEK